MLETVEKWHIMKDKIVWSVGLYSVNIVVCTGNYLAESFPIEFTDGAISKFIKETYHFDSRIDDGVFKIYAGLDGRNIIFTSAMMQTISKLYSYIEIKINDIEDILMGKNLRELKEEKNG